MAKIINKLLPHGRVRISLLHTVDAGQNNNSNACALLVNNDGYVNNTNVNNTNIGVRPAFL